MYRKFMMVLFLVSAMALGVAGCDDGGGGGGNGGGEGGSCDGYNGTSECLDYTGEGWDQTSAQTHCQGMQGMYSDDPCDLSTALGRCTISEGDPLQYYHNYYERVTEAEQACALNNGIWEPL